MQLPQPTQRTPVPPATYKVRLKKFEHGHSSNKGTPQITWTAEICEGEFQGKALFDRTMLVESSLWRVSNLIAACGVEFLGVDTDSGYFNNLCQSTLGRTTYWRVDQKTLQSGSLVNEVREYALDEEQESIDVRDETAAPSWVEE